MWQRDVIVIARYSLYRHTLYTPPFRLLSSPDDSPDRPATIRPMTDSRLWDRAAVVPAPVDGRRLPEVVALTGTRPTVAELFDFMRDAECRFGTVRMRIEERAATARGEDILLMDTVLRHPGDARVTTSRPGEGARAEYEVWISDGDLVRTYSSTHRLGTQRPIRNRPRGLDDRDFPGPSQGLRADHAAARWRPCPTRSSTRPATARTSWRPVAAR